MTDLDKLDFPGLLKERNAVPPQSKYPMLTDLLALTKESSKLGWLFFLSMQLDHFNIVQDKIRLTAYFFLTFKDKL